MLKFITLDEAREHLRSDTGADDNDVLLKIGAASQVVKNFLKTTSPWQMEIDSAGDFILDSAGLPVPEIDSAGQKTVRPEVKMAVCYLVASFYDNREGTNPDKDWTAGNLPDPVRSILYPLRTPTLA